MPSCIPFAALDKQCFKNDFAIILTDTSFQDFDIHSTITDADALSILPQYMIAFIRPSIIVFTGRMLEWFVN
jgi:hypothetical protein